MLILPMERRLDWKNPPLMTLLLVALNVLIFFTYQADDDRRQHEAFQYYQEELLPLEWPLYETHLLQHRQSELLVRLKTAYNDTRQRSYVAAVLGADRDFAEELAANGANYWEAEPLQAWKEARARFEAERDSISSWSAGLDPQRFRPITYFSHQFLHADLGHLIGNMTILLLVGFAVESVLGPGRMLGGYLLAGALGGALHTVLDPLKLFPLIGASGAISGLMGMYVALYRMQRIRFFYWLWIRFGYFQAPALAMLAVWVGKELFDWFRAPTAGIAYLAHAGGLLAGAGYQWLNARWMSATPVVIDEPVDNDLVFREALGKVLDAIGRMDFRGARERLQPLLLERPEDFRLLEQNYHLEKLRSDSADFATACRRLFGLGTLDETALQRTLLAYRDFDRLAGAKVPLDTDTRLKLVMKFARLGAVKEAEKLLKEVLDAKERHLLLAKAAQALASAFDGLQDPVRADRYRQLASGLNGNATRA